MRYEMMFADQIRRALKENWPLVIPVGVLEYHAEHCAVGTDTLLVARAVELLEKEMDLVLFPPFYLGAASYAVAPPAQTGSIHINAAAIHQIAKELFTALLRIGFKNIHLFIHHQSENFTAGMPTDLALRLAAREVIMAWLEKNWGEGWWGRDRMKTYYQQHAEGSDPFSWISVHPFMDAETQRRFPVDHAGKQETSLMLAFCPEGVDLKRVTGKKWFCASARQASRAYGEAAKALILARMRQVLGKGKISHRAHREPKAKKK